MTAPELPNAPEADAVGAPVEQPVRPQRWTAPSASPAEHGGFVAYGDHLEAVQAAVAAERAESARLRRLLNLARDDYNTAAQRLQDIGDYAHDHSTGPAVPDALWEVRSMAYGSGA